jgi:hypothetical protein
MNHINLIFLWGMSAGVFLSVVLLVVFRLTGLHRRKWNKETAKYILPFVVIMISFAIVWSNYRSLLHPKPIGKKAILNYVLTNPANLQLLLFITVIAIMVVIWIVMTAPFSFQGLSKFSGFGISAEFREKVNAVVEKNAVVNEITSIRENILRILTSDKYFNETLKESVVRVGEGEDSFFEIEPKIMLSAILDLVESTYRVSYSHFRLQYHLETVRNGEEVESKKNLNDLPKEMRDVSLQAINKGKPFLWKGALAVLVNPFKEEGIAYVMCIYSDEIVFTETDCESLLTLVKVAQKIVTLHWYESEMDNLNDETEEEVV